MRRDVVLPGVLALVVLLVLGAYLFGLPNNLGAYSSFNSRPGLYSTGVLSAGFFSAGVLSIGVFSIGVFSIGVFSVGLFSLGIFPIGLWVAGIFAVGFYRRRSARRDLGSEAQSPLP